MRVDNQQDVIDRLLLPEPLPLGFKRRFPKAYRYTPYSRKILRRLDLYTHFAFSIWIHLEWDKTISNFNERVAQLTVPCDGSDVIKLTPAFCTIDHLNSVCIHFLSADNNNASCKGLYTIEEKYRQNLLEFSEKYKIGLNVWNKESMYANAIEFDSKKQLLRYLCIPDQVVPNDIRSRILEILKRTRKTTIDALISDLKKDDPEWVVRSLAYMLQQHMVFSDIKKYPLSYATEISVFDEFI